MKKRLRKKRCKAELLDIHIDLSQDSAWREQLFASGTDEVFTIEFFRERAIRPGRFTVRRGSAKPGWLVPFIFESVEFSKLRLVSFNNPEAL